MLHPNQFEVDQAWIMFQINDEPIRTIEDGDFNFIVIMDAASCYIMGMETVAAGEAEPSEFEARRLLKSGWTHHQHYPETLYLPKGQFETTLPKVAAKLDIEVVVVEESELLPFIGEARQGFREYEGPEPG